jgi:ubiquinone biosynthesis protein
VKTITRLFRLIRINVVLVRYNLDEMILGMPWFYPIRFLSYFNPFHWTLKNKYTRGERLRLALENLGPIFIKAGQIVSTRRDIFPEDIVIELAKLQDKVAPFPGEQAKAIVEKAFGASIADIFSQFNLEALASASIAQVHAAILKDGRSVVLKILRPNIKQIIERDLDLLMMMASFAERYWKQARRFKPKEIINEIAQTLDDELDLMREGANASQLRRNFAHSPLLYVPEIYWLYCRPNVLVMEKIEGIPIYQIAALKEAGIHLRTLAKRCIEVFFTQVFRDSYFHADMHPGNLFVSISNIENPRLIAVDFGIMGSLNSSDQRYIAENMLAFFRRDYQRVAELHVESGWLPPDTRIDQFEGAIRAVSEPIFERPLKDISFGQLLLRLFQTAHRFNIVIQPQLILLQKTLLNIEGLGRQIDPEIDLWGEAAPQLQQWLKQQVGVKAFFSKIRNNLPFWSEKFPEIPSLVYEILKQTHKQKEKAIFSNTQGSKVERYIQKKRSKKYFLLGLGSALLLTGILIFIEPVVLPVFSTVLMGIAVIALIAAAI